MDENNNETTTVNVTQNPESGEYEVSKETTVMNNSYKGADPLNISCFSCGLLSIINNLIPGFQILPGYLYGTVAIILYIFGKGKNGKSFATTGLILGIIGIVISIMFRFFVLIVFKWIIVFIIELFRGLFA